MAWGSTHKLSAAEGEAGYTIILVMIILVLCIYTKHLVRILQDFERLYKMRFNFQNLITVLVTSENTCKILQTSHKILQDLERCFMIHRKILARILTILCTYTSIDTRIQHVHVHPQSRARTHNSTLSKMHFTSNLCQMWNRSFSNCSEVLVGVWSYYNYGDIICHDQNL